jgi:hypothetical protein
MTPKRLFDPLSSPFLSPFSLSIGYCTETLVTSTHLIGRVVYKSGTMRDRRNGRCGTDEITSICAIVSIHWELFRLSCISQLSPADAGTALPSLYTAIQEQLGLKLDATKALAEVLIIDHVEKPTEN